MADDHSTSRAGATPVARALGWVAAGLVALALVAVASAPELLGEPGSLSQLLVLVLAPGIPGLLVVLALVRRRRRRDRREDDGG